MELKEVIDKKTKSNICDQILRALPDWFGIEDSIVEYVNDVKDMLFYASYDLDQPVGFIAVKRHNTATSEVYVMGILKEYHKQGIGRALIEAVEAYCVKHEMQALTVKTLADTVNNEAYANTRCFYTSMGFIPLEIFPDLWGLTNPCLMLAKFIEN